jgi:hypothetical protein
VDLYRAWLGEHLGETVRLDATSRLLAAGADPQQMQLMEIFCHDYDLAAGLYNQAAASAGVGLHPLDTRQGELPFFAVLRRDGRLVRTGAYLRAGALLIGEDAFPLDAGRNLPVQALRAAGVLSLAGKAIVLVLQVRLGTGGSALALPYRGSLYMPAADRLAEALSRHGLLPAPLHPIVRVRFRLLDRMKSLHTTIRLPEHLAEAFGAGEITARRFSETYADVAAQAARRLDALKDPAGRLRVQREHFPELIQAIGALDARRRRQAEADPDPEKVRPLWKEMKSLKTDLLERTLRLIARDVHVLDIGLYDSRGALWPWCVALGGPGFYEELLSRAEIYEERVPA